MAVRSGRDLLAGLKRPRDVWIGGRKVEDVTTDPVFRRPVAAMARLYDLQTEPERRAMMTYRTEDGGEAGMSFLMPRTREDLVRRRFAAEAWADATFGLMGRSPDFMNSVVMSWAESPDFFARGPKQFADNVPAYYRYCRDNDVFITHALVNPQVDRSKSAAQQADPFAYLGVVEERKDGLIVRGAKMLATHGPTADELLVYPLPNSLAKGDERHALAFGIPCDTKGLKFICREPFDRGDQSEWDHPLGARFEEPDAVVVFEDVLVPWDRVFLYGDIAMGNTLFPQTSLQDHTGHQTAVRGLVKCRLMTALAIAMSRTVKTDIHLHVQEQLGELLSYLQLIEAAIMMSEEKATTTDCGTMRPHFPSIQALRYNIPKMYERMVQVAQVLGAGTLLATPTEADFATAIGPDIERYYRGAGVDARRKIQLFKLAWDATGTQFGQRQLQYERYYAGDPVRVGATLYLRHDSGPLLAALERLLPSDD